MAINQVEPEQYNSNRPDPFSTSTAQVNAENHKVQNRDSEIDDTEFLKDRKRETQPTQVTFEFPFSGQNIQRNPSQHITLPSKTKTTSSFLFMLRA